jgi:hypothetical protein
MAYGDEADIGQLIDGLPPGGFQTLLQAAWRFEADGEARTAAAVYRTALQAIPQFLSRSAEPILAHAKACAEANDRALESYLADRLGEIRNRHGNVALDRFDQCLDILLRKRRVYRPAPSFLYLPQMPAVEFHDRAAFPWLDALEAATDDIRGELINVLADGQEGLEPYIDETVPHDRWRELNRSRCSICGAPASRTPRTWPAARRPPRRWKPGRRATCCAPGRRRYFRSSTPRPASRRTSGSTTPA